MATVLDVGSEVIDRLYKRSHLKAEEIDLELHPNQYVTLVNLQHRVPCKADKEAKTLLPLNRKLEAKDIKPRRGNEEQLMLLDALMDDDIPVVVVTGCAGTGKTILTLASALQKVEDGKYDRIIITKPIVQIGEDFGILPGEVKDKFLPYLGNYTSNLEEIYGQQVSDPTLVGMEMVPIQFIRGVSWANKFVIADEIQSLSHHEILTLGTRVGKGTKLVLMGDIKQRDRDIEVEATGLHHLIASAKFQNSNLTAVVNLTKVERSPVTQLFTEVFE